MKVFYFLILCLSLFSACSNEESLTPSAMKLTSSAFENNSAIPSKYSCDGENINPPLQIGEIPENTKSLVLIVHDPDAPSGDWLHWIVFNISPTNEIAENSKPGSEEVNDFGDSKYDGPCPPSGTHHYVFDLYALDTTLNLQTGAKRSDIESAMQGHSLAKAELIGVYQRN